jgi:hypothetical protein
MTHSFFSAENIGLFIFLALAMAADGFSTQRFLSPEIQAKYDNKLYEINPLARPFVTKGALGQAFISSVGFLVTLGAALLLHHLNHHNTEQGLVFAVGMVSAFMAFRNLQF